MKTNRKKLFEIGFRLVLPDNMVIMPEDINGFDGLNSTDPSACIANQYRYKILFSIKDARKDLQSPFKDKNGKVLFDNDRVDINGVLSVLTYSDCWYLSNNVSITNCFARTFIEVEWKEVVPYGEERGKEHEIE